MAQWHDSYGKGQRVEVRVGQDWMPGKVVHRTWTGLPHVKLDEHPTILVCDRKTMIRHVGPLRGLTIADDPVVPERLILAPPVAAKRSAGERLRARQALERLRAICNAVEVALDSDEPPGTDVAQAVAHAAIDLGMTLARAAAYQRAEEDDRGR